VLFESTPRTQRALNRVHNPPASTMEDEEKVRTERIRNIRRTLFHRESLRPRNLYKIESDYVF